MEIKHKTFWDMLKNSITYAQNKQDSWQAIPVIKTIVDQLVATEKELEATVVAQDKSKTNGHTEQKNLAFSAHCRNMYKLGRKLTLYAKDTNNAVLRSKTDISESRIDTMADAQAITLFTSMLLLAREHQASAAAYGITTSELDALEAEQTHLKQLIAQRNSVSQERQMATRGIKDLIDDARKLLGKLDDAFEGMLDDDEMIAGWFDVRKIKGRRQTTDENETAATAAPAGAAK